MQLEPLLIGICILMCLYQLWQFVANWIRKFPVPPDPWEAHLSSPRKEPPTQFDRPPGAQGMLRLMRARDLSGIDVNLLKGLLEQDGIPCLIKNEYLAIAMGDLPPAECFQELWLLDAADYTRAKEIFDSWKTATPQPIVE